MSSSREEVPGRTGGGEVHGIIRLVDAIFGIFGYENTSTNSLLPRSTWSEAFHSGWKQIAPSSRRHANRVTERTNEALLLIERLRGVE